MFHFNHNNSSAISDVAASVTGFVMSILLYAYSYLSTVILKLTDVAGSIDTATSGIDLVKEGLIALCFGGLGAIGGYIVNKIIKWFEKKGRKW